MYTKKFKIVLSKYLLKFVIIFIIGLISRIIMNNIYLNTSIVQIGILFFINIFYILNDTIFQEIFQFMSSESELYLNQNLSKKVSNVNFKKLNNLFFNKNNSSRDYTSNFTNKNSNLLRESVANSNKDVDLYDRCKIKIYWIFIENRKDSYVNYQDYKSKWNSNIDLRKELKNWLKLQKKTAKWFLNRRN